MSKAVRKVALVAAGAALGFVTGGIGFALIGGAVGLFVGSQQNAALKNGDYSSEPSAQTVRSSKAPARFILGRASTGGVLVWAQEQSGDQTDGEWVHLVYVLSEGAIAGLDAIYLGEEEISTYGEYASYELLVDPSQTNAFLKANCRDWRDTQIGRGLSFVRLSLRHNAEKFPSGIPDVRFVVRGRKDLYDPRTGITGYSDNTALHMLWFLRARCKVPDDEIVFETFASAANVCDEAVANADGTAGIRYRTGCVIGADEQRTQVIQKLEESCAGQLIRVGGKWMMQAGAYYGPHDFEINEDMIVGTVTGTTEVNNDSAINIITGTFIDPSQTWAETDFPEVRIQQWVDEDGGEAAESMSLGYVTDAYQAQRLANIKLRRARAGGSLQLPMNFAGYNCRPGRVVRVNLPSLNMVGEFIVTDWNMAADDGCTVTVSQYEPAIFDDAVGQPYNPIGFINLPAGGLGSPSGLTWTPDGTAEVTQGVLSWIQPTGVVASYAVTVRQGATAIQAQQVPATTLQLPMSGLSSGNYTMSVAALGPMTRSGEATITVSIDGPPIPESCAVQATIDTITLVPSNILHGLNGGTYEYFFSVEPAATQGEYIGQGLSFTHTGLSFATNYAYFIRSKNAYGVSAFLKVVAATSMDVGAILDAITGQITESQLGKELTERIDLIDMDGPGSVNERIGEVRSDLNEQISDVNNHVNEVQNELQHQIDTIFDLADSMPYKPDQAYTAGQSVLGEDGRLYQAKIDVPAGNPPPNATYWTDIGQAVQTANGMAARVQTVETKVQNLEGTSSAQAQQITGLQSSLTTTNGNVAAAQQAAQDAAALAGGKGKVIVQSAAPPAADRLAQNLWIDTTGNANTPKRWNGSAWVAVTDKVATDAAAAAANALAVAQTKADASVVQGLTTRVTDAEGALSSQGQAITGLNNSLTTTNQNVTAAQQAAQAAADAAGTKGKVLYQSTAPAVADRLTQNLWIDTTSNANTPKRWNGSAWVAVTDKVATEAAAAAANALNQVATKADASTVQALSNTVDQQGASITANGQAITNINTSLTQVGGENLLYNPSFDKEGGTWKVDGWVFGVAGAASGTTGVVSSVVSTLDPTGRAMRFDVTGVNLSGNYVQAYVANRPGLSEGRQIAASVHFRGSTTLRLHLYLEFWSATAVLLRTPVVAMDATEAWQRPSVVATAPTGTVSVQILIRTASPVVGGGAGYLEVDRAQIEQGSVVTGWRDNGLVNATESAANASATSALTGRVAATETGLSSASSQLTQLDNSIGDMGGENLFYNPGFTKFASSNGTPEGWETEGPVTTTDTLVTSWLNTGEKAQRIVAPGLTNSSQYKSLRPSATKRIKVNSGQAVTASVYARKNDSDIGMRIFIQWISSAGAVISAPNSVMIPLTIAGSRATFSAVAPSGAAEAYVYFRIYALTSTATNGTVEFARPQAEYGARATGWRDNGQLNAANNSATSAAVDGLTSAVNQQGATLSSVSGRTTTLENAVNSTTNGLATKASATALDALTNRVSNAEGVNTSQSSSITELSNNIGAIQGVLGASGLDPAPNCLWQFDSTTEGWVAAGASLAQGAGFIKITATGSDPQLQSGTSANLSITGSLYSRVRVRITRRAGAVSDWDGQLFYQTAGHGFSASYRAIAPNPNLTVGQSAVVEWDMANLTWGGNDWTENTITRLRLDLGNTSGGVFDVDWIVVGQVGPSASSRALSFLDSKVTQQGDRITAEAQRTDGLYTSVGSANAAIQNEATARSSADTALGKRVDTVQSSLGSTNATVQQISNAQANLDGKVNATWSVKLGLTSGGSYYAAGFGLGLENQGGTFQSSFVVLANRFAVMNPVGEGLISPFAIQNGQVFISDALISNLSVQKAIVGNSINSSELANDGTPIMRMDFASGTLILLNKTATAYTVYNRRGIDMVINGVRRIRMGEWD
ncbi:phage tail tip fiber protein [Pseudomonas promysalinigenes]|uniref:phage tail protein n=1 Tax=Pseudomonas promysalinigenes TaxID=485898 RepID=UPI003F9FC33C